MFLPLILDVEPHAAIEGPVGRGEQDKVAGGVSEARVELAGFVAGCAVAAVEALIGFARRRGDRGVGDSVRKGEEDDVAYVAAVAGAVKGATGGCGVVVHGRKSG